MAEDGGLVATVAQQPHKRLVSLISSTDEDGRTLLHSAVSSGNLQLLDFLVQKGAGQSVNTADDERYIACKHSFDHRVPAVTGNKAGRAQGWTPLQSAVSAGHDQVAQRLLELHADPNTANSGGRTALHYTASKGRVAIISLLLKAGAKVNAQDSTGSTPLHRACSTGQIAAAKMLVQDGKAKVNIKDGLGQTPLFVAAASGHQPVALFLLAKCGADPEAEDKEGETPLSAAAAHGKLRDVMVAVAKRELDPDEVDAEEAAAPAGEAAPEAATLVLLRAVPAAATAYVTVGALGGTGANVKASTGEAVWPAAGRPGGSRMTFTTQWLTVRGVSNPALPSTAHPSSTPGGPQSATLEDFWWRTRNWPPWCREQRQRGWRGELQVALEGCHDGRRVESAGQAGRLEVMGGGVAVEVVRTLQGKQGKLMPVLSAEC
eukprot:jgi/Astpho2/8443/Aster-x1518